MFNFYGELSFKADTPGTKGVKYGEINFKDHDFQGPWIADTREPIRTYTSTFEDGVSSQACGASRYVFLDHPTFKMELKKNHAYTV